MAIAQQETPPPILNAKEIVELADKRSKSGIFTARDVAYDVMLLYYYGQQPSEGSVDVLAANTQGRPLLRDLERYKERAQIYSSQRLAPIVDDYQGMIGRMPYSRMEPPGSRDEDEQKAELLTKYLISTHEISDMDRQQADAGFHLPGLGDACYIFTPNGDKSDPNYRRVVWEVVNPRTAYPSFYGGHRRFQVYDLVLRTVYDPDVIYREYGVKPKSDKEEDCLVLTYLSPHQRTVVVVNGNRPVQVFHVEWDLGFCPAQWVYNKVNGRFAQSDIAQSLAHQDFLDFAYNILIDGLVRNVYGTIIGISNPQNAGQEPIVLGPNPPPILLQEDGRVTATHISGDIAPAMQMIEKTQEDMLVSSGTTEVRQHGMPDRSNISGRALHAAQGPEGTRIELKQQNMGAGMRMGNAMTLQMQELAPDLGNHKFEIFGRYKGKSFRAEMSGKDIGGWYRNRVIWDSTVGLNQQQKVQVAMEGQQGRLFSRVTAMEFAGVEDPLGEMERIDADQIRDAKTQAHMQTIMAGQQPGQGAPPGQPGVPGAPGQMPPGAGQPSPAESPAPLLRRPFGQAQQQEPQGLPGGVPQGVSRQDVAAKLATVKLKGGVWAIGDLAEMGQSVKPQLLVSDWKDQPLVMQTLKPVAPNISVKAVAEADLPEGAVRLA